MTLNEAVRSGARDRMVSGDDIAHYLSAGADYYPAASWPKTQPLRDSVWRQLATELDSREQRGSTNVSKVSGGGGGFPHSQGWGLGAFGMGAFGIGQYGQHGG